MRSLALLLLLLFAAPLARAEIRASLPLQGYSRPGSCIPVRLEGTTTATEIEISGDGVTPTRVAVSGGAVNVVVPVHTTASADGMVVREIGTARSIPIQPVGNRTFEGGVLARGRVLVGNATGARVLRIVAVSHDVTLDPADPVPGPAMAWETLDYLIVEPAGAARIGDGKLLDLLTAGVTILQLGERRPPGPLPWVRKEYILGRDDAWVLEPDWRGFRGGVFEHAMVPVAGTDPGAAPAWRRNVLLAGVLFTIVATGLALLLPPRRPRLAIGVTAAIVLLTLGGVHAWRSRHPAVSTVGGSIVVETGPFAQIDTWTYHLARRGATVNLPASARPIGESPDALARLRPTLRCAADGTPVGFSCNLPGGERLAVLARRLVDWSASWNRGVQLASPMLPLARRGYLRPGTNAAVVATHSPTQSWPTVVIAGDGPARRAATRPGASGDN